MKTSDIYQLIEERREELGLSQAEVGAIALGQPTSGPLQSLRRGASPSFERLQALAEALDLEFYFGRARSPEHSGNPVRGFAEIRAAIEAPESAPKPDQIFLPIPHARLEGRSPKVGSIAFMQDWFDKLGRPPDNLSFISIDGDHMAPEIPAGAMVLLDSSMCDPFDEKAASNIFAVSHEGRCNAHRLSAAEGDMVVFTHLNPSEPTIICKRSDLLVKYRILGQIVWSSAFQIHT